MNLFVDRSKTDNWIYNKKVRFVGFLKMSCKRSSQEVQVNLSCSGRSSHLQCDGNSG